MKYTAFAGTYNEQIYDSEKHTIEWTNYPEIVVKKAKVKLSKIWSKL
jgi:hypothetical protein